MQSQPPPSPWTSAATMPARQLPPAIKAMAFWDAIFGAVKAAFYQTKEPKPRVVSGRKYCIRSKTSWNEIYDELKLARTVYDGKGPVLYVKKGLRTFFNKVQLAGPFLEFIPQVEYVSPVVGALQLILEAANRSTQLRGEVAGAFSDDVLEQRFGNIETFLAIFPGDKVIENKSVQLLVSILKAIEDAIGYYVENILLRTVKSVAAGEDYKKNLRDSIAQVKSSSDALIIEAQTSSMKHISDLWARVHTYSEQLRENDLKILENQEEMKDNDKRMLETLRDMKEHDRHLLQDHQKLREGQIFTETSVIAIRLMLEGYIKAQDERFQELRQQLVELDQKFKNATQQNAAMREDLAMRLEAEALHFQMLSQHPLPAWYMTQEALYYLLAIPNLDETDKQYVRLQRDKFPRDHRERAEGVVTMRQFHHWITSSTSEVLLIHGDFEGMHYVSALSLLNVYLMEALEGTGRTRALVFFCGRHVDDRDGHIGAQTLITSLIAQLLREQAFDTTQLHRKVDLNEVQRGDVAQLCILFAWLARRVPADVTVFCLVDGVNYYERSKFAYGFGMVLNALMHLKGDSEMVSVFKILLTSSLDTTSVRNRVEFAGGKNILRTAAIPRLGLAPSSSRLTRQLGDTFGQSSRPD